jgi:D-amino-acid dehydrogenase
VKVAVLGAGVVGVATAYYLARDGHEVVLVERRARAAEEASFGNGGLVSPSDSYAWASPDALRMAVKSLYRSDLGIKYKLRLDPRLWLWSLQFLTQCTHAAARRNTLVKLRLIVHSKDCLNAVVAETGIDYDGRRDGILYYFRSRQGLGHTSR